ncbi:MAG TPA: hypothetical protein VMV69_01930 [Pirellulales bacterium]|nr:hypothetical protein [Pirellulales bacterium]
MASNDGGSSGGDDLWPTLPLSPVPPSPLLADLPPNPPGLADLSNDAVSPGGLYALSSLPTRGSAPQRPVIASTARPQTGRKRRQNSISLGDVGEFDDLLRVGIVLLRFVLGPLFVLMGCLGLLLTLASLATPRPTVEHIGIFKINPAFVRVAPPLPEPGHLVMYLTARFIAVSLFVGFGIALIAGTPPRGMAVLGIQFMLASFAVILTMAIILGTLKALNQ